MAKKGAASATNGRDSHGQRLGAKVGNGQTITAGSILFRQRGTRIKPGTNVRIGRDDTLFAVKAGTVKFDPVARIVHVLAEATA